MLEYGRFIEAAGLPESLLKFTLHMMACRVKDQCLSHGHLALDNEMFIERAIQKIKNILHGRATQFPELMAVNSLLRFLASARFSAEHNCQTIQEYTTSGMERETYEVDLGRSVSDDYPERVYYTG